MNHKEKINVGVTTGLFTSVHTESRHNVVLMRQHSTFVHF